MYPVPEAVLQHLAPLLLGQVMGGQKPQKVRLLGESLPEHLQLLQESLFLLLLPGQGIQALGIHTCYLAHTPSPNSSINWSISRV